MKKSLRHHLFGLSLNCRGSDGLMLVLLSVVMSAIECKAQTDVVQRQDTLQEVVVTSQAASRRVNDVQIGVEKVDVETMSRLPSLFGERDIIKGLQLLPGVKMEGDGLGGYEVRGGTSAQNHVLLDGASVYNVGHLMGLFSAFNDDAVGSADLYKGLMPARYGGGASSVLSMSNRVGDVTKHHFSMSVGILSAKTEADGPMGSNGSSYLVAARTSYLNLFIKASQKYKHNSMSFYDINAKLNFRLSDNDMLYLSLFRSNDDIGVEDMVSEAWSNTTASLGWLHTGGLKHHALTQLVASDYSTDQSMDVYSFSLSMQGYDRQVTLRHQQTWTPNHHTLNIGGETTLIGLQSAAWRIVKRNEREKRDAWNVALWVSDDMSFFKEHLQLSAGLRMEWISALGGKPYYNLDDNGNIIETMYPKKWSVVKTYPNLQPRVSLSWKIGKWTAFKAGYSRLTQVIQPIRNSSMSMPLDRLTIISNNIKPLGADQLSAGLSMMTEGGKWDFSADVYWKKQKNVYDFREGKSFNSEIEIEQLLTGGRGKAYGLEIAAHKNTGRMTGWMAYTLSWVKNQIDGIMNGEWYTASNDRRHDFVIVVMYPLTKHWELSSTWRFTTGQAMTAPAGKYEVSGYTYYFFGDRNKERAPDYHRLDISAAHSKTKGRVTRTWTFGLYNAYNRYNPFFVSFKNDDTKPSGTKAVVTTLFGIVPTISFSLKY